MKSIENSPALLASLVDLITSAPGKTPEQSNSATYLRIKEGGGMAIVLKLADRIAHVEEAIQAAILKHDSKLLIHENEYIEFREALYEPKNTDAMWAHMDRLDEIANQMMTRLKLTPLANRLSSPSALSMLESPAWVSPPPRQ